MLRSIQTFFRRAKRTLQYLPVIWKGEDWDSQFAIELFKIQLQRTANTIEANQYLEKSDWVVQRIRTAVKLIDRGYYSFYQDEIENHFEALYGTSRIEWLHTNVDIVWAKAKTSKENEEINRMHSAQIMAASEKSERAKAILWKLVSRYIDTWWD